MNNNILKNAVKLAFLFFIIAGMVSCNKETQSIGVGLVSGDKFKAGVYSDADMVAWSVKDRSDTINARNFSTVSGGRVFNFVGRYNDPQVGHVDASFATQLLLSGEVPLFGDEIVDSVVLSLPYSPNDLGELYNSIMGDENYFLYGNIEYPMDFRIYQLAESVPTPSTPIEGSDFSQTEIIRYDKDWAIDEIWYRDSDFKINLDTSYVTQIQMDDEGEPITDEDGNTQIDTLQTILPQLRIMWSPEEDAAAGTNYMALWQDLVSSYAGQIMTSNNLRERFKGFYFTSGESTVDPSGTPLMFLNLSNPSIQFTLYYHTSESLAKTLNFSFNNSYTAHNIKIDYDPFVDALLTNPDTVKGADKLFVLPFGGAESVVKILSDEQIQMMRDSNWLINEALLELKIGPISGVEERMKLGEIPQLWLYKYDYRNEFTFPDPNTGGAPSSRVVSYYLPDEYEYIFDTRSKSYLPVSNGDYYQTENRNGIVDKGEDFDEKGVYKFGITAHVNDLVYNDSTNVKLGVRLPFGATEAFPFRSVLNGAQMSLKINYSRQDEGTEDE